MNPFHRIAAARLALCLAVSLTAMPASFAQDATDPTVATVDGKDIKRSDLVALKSGLSQEMSQVPLEAVYDDVLDYAITMELLGKQAREAGLDKASAYLKRLHQEQNRLLFEAFVQRRIDTEVTDEALKAVYDKQVASAPAEEEVRARHILVRSEEEAKAIIAKLKDGGDFAQLAQGTVDRGSAAQGGDLGYFTKGRMVPEFEAAAFALKPGETTQAPVQSQFGWHIIRVEDRRPAKPESFEQMEPKLRKEMVDAIYTKAVEEARAGAEVKRFKIDGSAE